MFGLPWYVLYTRSYYQENSNEKQFLQATLDYITLEVRQENSHEKLTKKMNLPKQRIANYP